MKITKVLNALNSIKKVNNITDSLVNDAETITISRNGRDVQIKVSDYCVVKFPFACMAKPKHANSDNNYYPVKLEGYYSNGRVIRENMITEIKSLYDGPYVFFGHTSSQEYEKRYYDNAIACYPKDIKNLNSYWRKATKEEVKQYLKSYWYGWEIKDSVNDEEVLHITKLTPEETNGSKAELEDIKIMPYGKVTKSQWEAFLRKAKWPYWLDWDALKHELNDSIKDKLDDEDIDDLIAEEYEAIADYDEALKVATCPHAREQLEHIRAEEVEHVRELEELKAKKETEQDSKKK